MAKINPFENEVMTLRVPLKSGEVTVDTLTFHPPTVKDALATDKYPPDTVANAIAMASSLTGVPEVLFSSMVPEDFADMCVIVGRTKQRFFGEINLFDTQKEGPTSAEADTAKPASQKTSAQL
ncbi:MAG: phage tail assembly protein [Treponema sp.]|nr:phage tail assembly protein [Treponema sp.]